MTLAQAETTVQFDQALLHATARAKAAYPAERCRIERGLQIALADGVTLFADGSAMVQSQSHADTRYHVNGACECKDGMTAPGGRCKHKWSKSLVKFATKYLAEQPTERYYASATMPSGDLIQGIATWTPYGWLFVDDDGAEPFYCAIQALALGGRCDIADVKRAEEEAAGGLAALVCGYGR